jgi:predicted Fe-S protein YdhL (DUF1289 family)
MNDIVARCLGCGRYRADDGRWVEMRIEPKDARASHTYCEECAVAEERKVDEFERKMRGGAE